MVKYVIVDLKTNEKFEKEYQMPIGYGFYLETIFDDFDTALRNYDILINDAPKGAELDNIVIEMHENGEKSIVYDYSMYREEYEDFMNICDEV